jgi:hypothetical protein
VSAAPLVYLAGPISYGGAASPSLVAANLERMTLSANYLRGLGYEVINPAEFEQVPGKSWSDYMREGIAAVLRAQIVAVLDGWETSAGAIAETDVARVLRVPVVPFRVLASQPPGEAAA